MAVHCRRRVSLDEPLSAEASFPFWRRVAVDLVFSGAIGVPEDLRSSHLPRHSPSLNRVAIAWRSQAFRVFIPQRIRSGGGTRDGGASAWSPRCSRSILRPLGGAPGASLPTLPGRFLHGCRPSQRVSLLILGWSPLIVDAHLPRNNRQDGDQDTGPR